MAVAAGLFSATAPVASDAACPAYPWPNDGLAQGGGRKKVFMQSDCAACHSSSMLPYAKPAPPRQAAVAEIVVVVNQLNEQPAATRMRPLRQATYYTPDLSTTVATRMMVELLRRNNPPYAGQELMKKVVALPAPALVPAPVPVWLGVPPPYLRK